MTYEYFLDELKNKKIQFSRKSTRSYNLFENVSDDALNEDSCISCRWVTGGLTGGSCWGTERYPRQADEEPEFESLNEVLSIVCPNITYLQAQKVLSLIEKASYTSDGDYYGNSIEYSIKYINLKNLYDKLFEIGLLRNRIILKPKKEL